MNIEEKLLQELESMNQPLGVVSTVNEHASPESASLYYVHDSSFNLFFITRKGSRKYQNIEKNPNVSFVITSENSPLTIQLEGTAGLVTEAKEESEYFPKLVALASAHTAIPPVSQINGSEMVFVKITPRWIRSGNFEVMRGGDKLTEVSLS